MCYYSFCASTQNIKKNTKNIYLKKIQRNNRSEKRMLNAHKMTRNWLRRFKNTKKKFNSIFLTNESSIDKENSIGEKKNPKSYVYGLN